MRNWSWQALQVLPTSPKATLTAAASPVAAALASSVVAALKLVASLPTSGMFWNSSGFTRVFWSPIDLSVPGPPEFDSHARKSLFFI